SKSGSTLEPNILKQYFFERAKAALGSEAAAAQHFVAITDPGSSVEKTARAEGFRRVCHGLSTIGGRYSVLSDFGMVPAAAIGLDAAVAALEAAGHPVVRITLSDATQLGQEFFRWEMATAVAGAIIGINPFDQPDVEAQKVKTRELTTAYEKTGSLPAETPF